MISCFRGRTVYGIIQRRKTEDVRLIGGRFEPDSYVSIESAEIRWRWAIFPKDFEAWNLVEQLNFKHRPLNLLLSTYS